MPAQKNVAPAGVTIVIVRKISLESAPANTPVYLDYATTPRRDRCGQYTSMQYIAGEVFKYLLKNGGVKATHERDEKANLLWLPLDKSEMSGHCC